MICIRQCSKQTDLYSNDDYEQAKKQFPNYNVVTAERISHKGNRVHIDSRAIVFAPVGNISVFKDSSGNTLKVPRIAIVGFSTSERAMKEFYDVLSRTEDFNYSCSVCSFSGSSTLRRNIIRFAKFLDLSVFIEGDFLLDNMFDVGQQHILYTQIIKCCSVGNVGGLFKSSSAIYSVDKKTKQQYLDSGHMECVKTTFVTDMNFENSIPLVLIVKPAWTNLKTLDLLGKINGEIVSWIPHPSDPGNEVYKLLDAFESGLDFSKFGSTESTKQLIDLRNRIKDGVLL